MGWLDTWLDVLVPKTNAHVKTAEIDASSITVDDWMAIAHAEIGISEIAGKEDNPRILEYHQETSLKASSDEVPWCSSYVNWVFQQVGIEGTDKANARSWTHWGIPLEFPKYGCIVVLKRGANASQGHVGFYLNDAANGRIMLLSGNVSDKVCIASFPKKDVIAYRYPYSLP